MSARFKARLDARVRANAELCKVPLTEWQMLSRRERRRRVQLARAGAPAVAPCWCSCHRLEADRG